MLGVGEVYAPTHAPPDGTNDVEIFVAFTAREGVGDGPYVNSEVLYVPSASRLGGALTDFAITRPQPLESMEPTLPRFTLTNQEHPLVATVGGLLCDRVDTCHGIIAGRCWALGAPGVASVLEEALRRHGYAAPGE